MRKFVSSSTSRYTTVLIGPPPLHWLCYHYMRSRVRKSGNGEMSENMTSPVPPSRGGCLSTQKRPAAKYSGAQELMLFYLDAQAEQLAQEAQSGCSSAQMRSAEGVHWSA